MNLIQLIVHKQGRLRAYKSTGKEATRGGGNREIHCGATTLEKLKTMCALLYRMADWIKTQMKNRRLRLGTVSECKSS